MYKTNDRREKDRLVREAMSKLATDAQKARSNYIMTDKEMNDIFDYYFGDIMAKTAFVEKPGK